MKRDETQEERVARKRAKFFAGAEERERRLRARALERRIERLARHIENIEAREISGHEYEPIDLKRL